MERCQHYKVEKLANMIRVGCFGSFSYETANTIARGLVEQGVFVPLLKVGDKVYTVLTVLDDESIEERYFISEDTVAEVGVNGVWLDACSPPEGMNGDYIPYEKLFEMWHLSYEQAEKALEEKKNEMEIEQKISQSTNVVEVVHCGRCKHFRLYGKTSINVGGIHVKAGWCQRCIACGEKQRMLPLDFCSYGEKKQ